MIVAIEADAKIDFIGATANNILSVIIVGTTTIDNVTTELIAPNPTAIPPRHPTIKRITQINPKRLNSDSLNNLSHFEIVT